MRNTEALPMREIETTKTHIDDKTIMREQKVFHDPDEAIWKTAQDQLQQEHEIARPLEPEPYFHPDGRNILVYPEKEIQEQKIRREKM